MKTTILFHEIEYSFKDFPNRELKSWDEEHIHYMINQGFSSGELDSHEPDLNRNISGWWQIKGFETQKERS